MCELHQTETYRFEFVSRIREWRERHSNELIVKARAVVEEAFRSKTVGLTRTSEKVHWGEALVSVLNESMHLQDLLRKYLARECDQMGRMTGKD